MCHGHVWDVFSRSQNHLELACMHPENGWTNKMAKVHGRGGDEREREWRNEWRSSHNLPLNCSPSTSIVERSQIETSKENWTRDSILPFSWIALRTDTESSWVFVCFGVLNPIYSTKSFTKHSYILCMHPWFSLQCCWIRKANLTGQTFGILFVSVNHESGKTSDQSPTHQKVHPIWCFPISLSSGRKAINIQSNPRRMNFHGLLKSSPEFLFETPQSNPENGLPTYMC